MLLVLLGQARVSWEVLSDMCIAQCPGLLWVQLKYIELPLEIQNCKASERWTWKPGLSLLSPPLARSTSLDPFYLACCTGAQI